MTRCFVDFSLLWFREHALGDGINIPEILSPVRVRFWLFFQARTSSKKDMDSPMISIIQWLTIVNIKGEMWMCTDSRYAWHQSTISALLCNNYHSKQTWLQACNAVSCQVFINTRTSLTKDISFPGKDFNHSKTILTIEPSDVNLTKFKTFPASKASIDKEIDETARDTNPLGCYKFLSLLPCLHWFSSWAPRKA